MTSTPGELVGLPDGGPTTLALVRAQLKLKAEDMADDELITENVEAVNNVVRSWRISQLAVGAEQWPPRVIRGATMLAARLFRRRNSPAGVEAFTSEGAIYVQRNDPDVAMLLQLGSYSPPMVG